VDVAVIVPIPGARKAERIQENLNAASVELTDNEFRELTLEAKKRGMTSSDLASFLGCTTSSKAI
jgi:aryl-alcohol dehydrogenase-like predicted oxidoreductase